MKRKKAKPLYVQDVNRQERTITLSHRAPLQNIDPQEMPWALGVTMGAYYCQTESEQAADVLRSIQAAIVEVYEGVEPSPEVGINIGDVRIKITVSRD